MPPRGWTGAGTRGPKGKKIPISGRIVNIVDIYDALRSKRPYKEAFDHERSCEIINGLRLRFDPVIFEAFQGCAEEFRRLFDENQQEHFER